MAEEWMGRLNIKVAGYNYKKNDRHQEEEFINGIYDYVITSDILKELTTIKKKQITTQMMRVSCGLRDWRHKDPKQ